MISIEEAERYLDEVASELPAEFYNELNGGIILLPEVQVSPEAVNNDLFTMGEYRIERGMGRYIVIYYGSFEKVYGHCSKEVIELELKKTLLHEFTHHLESLGGERDLEIEDEIFLEEYREKRK